MPPTSSPRLSSGPHSSLVHLRTSLGQIGISQRLPVGHHLSLVKLSGGMTLFKIAQTGGRIQSPLYLFDERFQIITSNNPVLHLPVGTNDQKSGISVYIETLGKFRASPFSISYFTQTKRVLKKITCCFLRENLFCHDLAWPTP